MAEHTIAYTESPNPVFRLFKSHRETMEEPERVEVSATGTEIRFQPTNEEDAGLSVTPSTGDISAAGLVSNHDLDIEEGRYEAVAQEDSRWAIDVGEGQPDPVGGRDEFVERLHDGLADGNIEEAVTVDEVRANSGNIDDKELLEQLVDVDDRKSAVEVYEPESENWRATTRIS